MKKHSLALSVFLLMLFTLVCAAGKTASATTYDIAIGQVYLKNDGILLPKSGT